MNPKLVLLKTGEYIVTQAQEAYSGEGEFMFYVLTNPRLIKITGTYAIDDKHNTSVSLFVWPQFSIDTQVELQKDAILTIVEPTAELTELYNQSCGNPTTDLS